MTEAILPRKTVSKHLFRPGLTLVSALIAFLLIGTIIRALAHGPV